jgi:ribosome-associated protein
VTDQPDRSQDAAADVGARPDPVPATEAAPPGDRGRRRPGLPVREPGQVRPRRAKVAAGSAGDGTIDPGEPDPAALKMARRIVDLASDKKASDIILLDVRALTAVTDYFIICSGASERQLGAIADGIAQGLKDDGLLPIGREGGPSAHWSLLDYGAAIVHIMAPPERAYYQLEKLWADATLLLHVL